MKRMRNLATIMLLAMVLVSLAHGVLQGGRERVYKATAADIKIALTQLGAYEEGRLPSLDGFIADTSVQTDQYQRPYYGFKIEIAPTSSEKTVVRVKATVSAWYALGQHPGYQVLPSNGHLENDLLDRLGDYLQKNGDAISTSLAVQEKRLADLTAQLSDGEKRVSLLSAQLAQLQQETIAAATGAQMVVVVRHHAPILSAPSENATVLLRADLEDQFQTAGERGTWLQIKLDGEQTGWIQRAHVKPAMRDVEIAGLPAPAASREEPGFAVIREGASAFDGEWAPLKGKTALFLWTTPSNANGRNGSADAKLRFVEAMFAQKYREALHSSQDKYDGIVLIFMDAKGGIAAASLEDVGSWLDGSLSRAAFLKRCSLDPVEDFGLAQRAATTRRGGSQHAPTVSSGGTGK